MRNNAFGNITGEIDLPQVAFWVFFLGFVLLCWYLRRADKREGYPLKASPFSSQKLQGYPVQPPDQVYLLNEGGTTTAPHHYEQPDLKAKPLYPFDGTPLSPVGNPLLAGIGPGAWVMRRDEPMLTEKGEPVLQPLRLAEGWSLTEGEADPRGMAVFDWRWHEVGVVRDIWVDKAIRIMRLLEIEPRPGLATGRVLVPIFHTDIKEKAREVRVTALDAAQFADIPMPARPDVITAREDERLNAYFAAGRFYRDEVMTGAPTEKRL